MVQSLFVQLGLSIEDKWVVQVAKISSSLKNVTQAITVGTDWKTKVLGKTVNSGKEPAEIGDHPEILVRWHFNIVSALASLSIPCTSFPVPGILNWKQPRKDQSL